MTTSNTLLEQLNSEYLTLHETYEDHFWKSYMGDHTEDAAFDAAKQALEVWKTCDTNLQLVLEALRQEPSDSDIGKRLTYRKNFFQLYQTPAELLDLRKRITELETAIQAKMNGYTWGYTDPHTGEKITTSKHGVQLVMSTHDDEAVRRACFDGLLEGAPLLVEEYISLVALRNEYAKALGFQNFYYYKAQLEERMSADTIFGIFDSYYEKTKGCFQAIRDMEGEKPGIRKPWNMNYMLSGSFTKEEDPYYPLETVLQRWGQSFRNLGLTFDGATLQLDLLYRQGKYDNGFCHYPTPVAQIGDTWTDYRCNFTCNALPGKVGSGLETEHTLFHEGGHACDRGHAKMQDICLNTEYPPSSTAWAETHSMFCDTMNSSIEWKMRYAKSLDGSSYPFDLYARKVHALQKIAPKWMYGIAHIIDFEKHIYSADVLTRESVLALAREMSIKYNDFDTPSLGALMVPHIYSWESACSYHGYGLATLALTQWRRFFYERDGYIVDNPAVGKAMKKARATGAAQSFEEHVLEATGQPLSPDAYIEEVTMTPEQVLERAKIRLARMETVPCDASPIDLDAHISMVHGKEVISTNEESFEKMVEGFAAKVRELESKA